MLRFILLPLLAYVAAAPLTSKISMDVTQTEWGNLWTYVIWACSFVIWWAILLFLLMAAVTMFKDRL